MRPFFSCFAAVALPCLVACQSGPDAAPARGLDASAPEAPSLLDAGLLDASLSALPANAPGFCQRPGDDAVRDLFCTEQPHGIDSLQTLQARLALSMLSDDPGSYDASAPIDPYTIINTVVVLGHSTALGAQGVSPINPRAILLGDNSFLAFQRGVQQVELITRARDRNALDFYLLTFSQACNARAGGCTPGDLFTPSVERDWLSIDIRDDEQLKNTPSDCRQCHQRATDTAFLLMRELESPWTHFFSVDPENAPPYPGPLTGRDLTQDYTRAKGDEPYAGLPASTLRHTVAFALENLVGAPQPLFFDAPSIGAETDPTLIDGGSPGALRSPTWDRAYQAFQRGEQLALPHYAMRPTDLDKQASLSAAYRRYLTNELPAEQLPDLADIYPDDPVVRAELGLQTVPGATPAEVLVQACGSCHNDVLDQTLTRARFNIALSRMSQAELELAIARVSLAKDAPGVMPPPGTRQLDANARAPLLDYLRANMRSADDDALLRRAAELGMAGGARR